MPMRVVHIGIMRMLVPHPFVPVTVRAQPPAPQYHAECPHTDTRNGDTRNGLSIFRPFAKNLIRRQWVRDQR
jgi:hypothetical protein